MLYLIPIFILLHFLVFFITILIETKRDSFIDKDSLDYKISKLSKNELRIELKNKIDLINSLEHRVELLDSINVALLTEIADKEDNNA